MKGEEDDGDDEAARHANAQTTGSDTEAALMQQFAINRLRKIADVLGLGIADMLKLPMQHATPNAEDRDLRNSDARELASLFSNIDDDDSRRLLLDLARLFVARRG